MAASRLACASRCPHTARHAGPRRRPHPGPAARPCQRVAYDVPTRPAPGDQTSRCRAPRTRRAARPRGAPEMIASPVRVPRRRFHPRPASTPTMLRRCIAAPRVSRRVTATAAMNSPDPPIWSATWSPRRLARAAPNWMFCVRSLPQPNGPANALDLPMSAHTRRDGPGCRSTGRSVVVAIRSATRTGLHVRSKRRCPASPAQVDAQTRVVRPPPGQVLL